MSSAVEKIISGDHKEIKEGLQEFLEKNAKTFAFNELNTNNKRAELWASLFGHLNNAELSELHTFCLSTVRILSREKKDLNELVTEERIAMLLEHAHSNKNYDVAVEALKCLCNIIYNSTVAAAICSKNRCTTDIVTRIKQFRDSQFPIEVKIFNMKVLFLISALCSEVRPKLKEDLHDLKYLIEILEGMVLNADKTQHNNDIINKKSKTLSDSEVDLACEVLKVLFNLTAHMAVEAGIDEEEEATYKHLVTILRSLLVCNVETSGKRLELHNHTVNLLTNMPSSCFKELAFSIDAAGDCELPKCLQFEEQNVEAVYNILEFLKGRFLENLAVRNQQELLTPILTLLLKGVTNSRTLRKYLRTQILPPLRDVHNRPEQGTTVRNHLCRLLTTPITNVRDLTADFLFILCKENVKRMIKYTGYGNAAGLFAKRGLLGGRQPDEGHYSSDSEDSDTEEYREHKHGINPVTGCYEPDHPSPLPNMNEEEKEYEAMKLAKLIDDLTRKGIVQPCRIGEDGRPQPIDHVLQLQEDLPQQQQIHRNTNTNENSES